MIKNQIILEKVLEKTKESPSTGDFVRAIFDIEAENKQYKSNYTKLIAKYASQKEMVEK